jgi:hypothetical protein
LAKPFSIQAPEDIAKEYAGNKQMIAQAAQMGVVDPTAAVLAGMFIDRMRSAQVMEAGQMPSVAQQVLGGQPPAPPAPPAGLGATPEAAAMPPMDAMPPMSVTPPQEMPAPQDEMPMMAEGGMVAPYMAGGGLSEVPLPDGMFDEPSNGGFGDGYAGGGMVAFADGGSTGGFGSFIEQTLRKIDPNIQIAGRARTPARNAQVGGVAGSYHLIDAARDVSVPPGMSKPQFIAQLKSVFGADYDVLPSKGNSVHIEPGPRLGEKVRAGARPLNAPVIAPERDIGTAEGRASSREDLFQELQRRFGATEEEKDVESQRLARAKEMASDEYYEKQRKESMWETLANIGFNMASSKSPNLLQAVGEAAAAAMPGARVDKKERKALKDRALDIMGDINGLKRKENLQLFGLAVELDKEGRQQEQFEQNLAISREELQLGRDKLNAEIEAARNTGMNVSSTVFSMFNSGNPAMKAAAEEWILLNNPPSGSGVDVAQRLKELKEGRDGTKPQAAPAGGSGFKYLGTE